MRSQRDYLFGAIRSWLSELDETSLEQSFLDNGRAAESTAGQRQAVWIKEARRFHEELSDWMQAGLGRPNLIANFDYWAKMAKFHLDEAALLSLGLEPTQHFRHRLEIDKPKRQEFVEAEEFALRRLEIFRRQFAQISRRAKIGPKELVEWVRVVELDCHPGFLRMLDVIDGRESSTVESLASSEDSEAAVDIDRAPEGREMASLARLLTAIAMEDYGYRPESLRSPIPREFQDITYRQGLSVSQDTIRKYLRIGAKYLPKDDENG